MTQVVRCPACETRVAVAEEMNGRWVKCPHCQQALLMDKGQLWIVALPETRPVSSGQPRVEDFRSRPRGYRPIPNDPGLSGGLLVLLGIVFVLIPAVNVIVSSVLYYAWRTDRPRCAKQINLLGYAIFGFHALCFVGYYAFMRATNPFEFGRFRTFASAEGGFKAALPGQPHEVLEKANGLNLKTYVVSDASGTFLVGYLDADIPEREPMQQVWRRCEDLVRKWPEGFGTGQMDQRPVTLSDKYFGSEFEGQIPNSTDWVRFRMYVVHKRVYVVLVRGERSFLKSDDADRFLAAFRLANAGRP